MSLPLQEIGCNYTKYKVCHVSQKLSGTTHKPLPKATAKTSIYMQRALGVLLIVSNTLTVNGYFCLQFVQAYAARCKLAGVSAQDLFIKDKQGVWENLQTLIILIQLYSRLL